MDVVSEIIYRKAGKHKDKQDIYRGRQPGCPTNINAAGKLCDVHRILTKKKSTFCKEVVCIKIKIVYITTDP